MTNIPSDLLSDDSELLESVGFIYRDGEMKPIQKPKLIGNIPYKIMYVHKQADCENIISYDEVSTIHWYKKDTDGNISEEQGSFNVGTVSDIKSVGNTLICATDQGLHYLLFKGGVYKDLGTELPKPKFEPFLVADGKKWLNGSSPANLEGFLSHNVCKCEYDSNGKLCTVSYVQMQSDFATVSITQKITENSPSSYCNYNCFYIKSDNEQNQSSVQDAIKGHVASQIKRVRGDNKFAFPFFLRFAIRLFDGTYARISNPIIMYPSVRRNNMICNVKKFSMSSSDGEAVYNITSDSDASFLFAYDIKSYALRFSASIPNISLWSDIISAFVVFASEEVYPFYLDEKWNIQYPNITYNTIYHDACVGNTYESKVYNFDKPFGVSPIGIFPFTTFVPTFKTDEQIKKELLNKTVFYKLFECNANSDYVDGTIYSASDIIELHTIENLNTQIQLQKDDYYGWCKIAASKIYPYNSRINVFKASRFAFDGFNLFRGMTAQSGGNSVKYAVHIKHGNIDTWVESPTRSLNGDLTLYNDWFYYPDPNAKEVVVIITKNGTTTKYNLQLTPHKMLNGSYAFKSLPPTEMSGTTTQNIIVKNQAESLDSQIFTSVVNNPFVFEASGDNTVGTGKILGIVANTEAVSQGQFGQYPLMVFTDEGIYGMSVNSEGLYSATYPISREVCLENSPLVPTDRLIFFASKKGLMAASGGSVGCMSELLRGRAPINFTTLGEGKFLDFLKDCQIAYDYKDSMLRIFSEGKSYQYIYNMVDKTFSMVNSGITARSVVNDYPDNLIQGTDGSIYSLTGKPEVNDDTNIYDGTITTRPLKLGGSMTLKSLRNIKNLRSTQTGKLQLEIWGSNNAMNWCKLRSLGGKPWSYFTFRYTLTDFKACDSFAGSIVDIQNRREQR